MPHWFDHTFFGIALWQFLILLCFFGVGFLVRLFVVKTLGFQSKILQRHFNVVWAKQDLLAVVKPIALFCAAMVFGALLPFAELKVRTEDILYLAVRVVAAFSSVWCVYSGVDLLSVWLQQRAIQTPSKLDDQLVPLIRRALKIAVVAVGTIFVLQNLKVDVASLLAGLGIGGLALALAAKETLSNLFGSATIFTDKPFQIGDWIVIGDKEGIVENVGFRSTRIRTLYNSIITIPNAKVADSVIDNHGNRMNKRVFIALGLTYDTTQTQMNDFLTGVRSVLQNHPLTIKDRIDVYFQGFAESSLTVEIIFHFALKDLNDYVRERQNIYFSILTLAQKLNIQFAFPTQTLHLKSETPPAQS